MKKRDGWFWNTVLYEICLFFILSTAVYADFYDAEPHRLTGRLWLVAAGVLTLAPLVLRHIRARQPKARPASGRMSPRVFRIICFGCSLAVLGFCFLAVNPGGFDGDPLTQLEQVITGEYDDYFPVLHSLIAFWFPLWVTGGWFPSIILFQILLFSLALTCVCDTVRMYSRPCWGFLSLGVILANPITQSYLMYGYKDETFGICAMLLCCMNARILFSGGEWLKKPARLAAFAALLAVTSLVRYNGFLFAVPCALSAAICVSRKRALAFAAAALALFAAVRWPLSSALGVRTGSGRSSQTMGLPMSVLGGAVTYRPEKLDEELLDFAYRVAPREVWEEKYEWGVYNWVDWDSRTNGDLLAETGFFGALKYMFRALAEAPKESLKALIETTSIVYGVIPDHLANGTVFFAGEHLGLREAGIPWMREIMDRYRAVIALIAPHSFLHSGVTLLILLTALLAIHPLNRRESLKYIVPVMSVFCYNLVTMFVLYSWWDGGRFFHYSLWVLPVLLVMLTGHAPEGAIAEAAIHPGTFFRGIFQRSSRALPAKTAIPERTFVRGIFCRSSRALPAEAAKQTGHAQGDSSAKAAVPGKPKPDRRERKAD